LIEKIRVPRGKTRNRVRKQLKDVDPNLKENSDKMDEIFKELQLISKEFVKKIDSGEYEDFENLYNNYNNKIQEFMEEIPIIQKNIREFGIY
jgi:NifB/MoaA-like Fe-S oxidoreductase